MTAHISDDGSGREESVAEHTEKTTYLCREKGKRCGISQIMSLCGILHDMGKNKQKFDDYIHGDERKRKKLRGKIGHASTGAKYIYDSYHESPVKVKILTELVTYAVAAHHGLFDCVNEERLDIFSKKLSEVEDYEEACRNTERDYLLQYEPEKVFEKAQKEFDLLWDKMKRVAETITPLILVEDKREKRKILSDCRSFLFASLQRLLLSVLIDADWEATTDFMNDVDTLSKRIDVDHKKIFVKAGENAKVFRQSTDLAELKECIRKAQRYTVNVRENQFKKFDGLIQRVSEDIPGLYMVAAPGAYTEERGITAEWESLIF